MSETQDLLTAPSRDTAPSLDKNYLKMGLNHSANKTGFFENHATLFHPIQGVIETSGYSHEKRLNIIIYSFINHYVFILNEKKRLLQLIDENTVILDKDSFTDKYYSFENYIHIMYDQSSLKKLIIDDLNLSRDSFGSKITSDLAKYLFKSREDYDIHVLLGCTKGIYVNKKKKWYFILDFSGIENGDRKEIEKCIMNAKIVFSVS